MKRAHAIAHFGSVTKLARAIGCSRSAVAMWPEDLTDRMRDRVQAALYRREREARSASKTHDASMSTA